MVRGEKEANQNERNGTKPFESIRGVTNRVHAERMRKSVARVFPRAERMKRWYNQAIDGREGDKKVMEGRGESVTSGTWSSRHGYCAGMSKDSTLPLRTWIEAVDGVRSVPGRSVSHIR
jgi:hypothetical protein